MSKEIYQFDTEVTISIEETKIVAKHQSGSFSIDNQNLDSFSYSAFWEGKFSPAVLLFRFVGISLAIMIFAGFISDSIDAWSVDGWVSFLSIVGILVVINVLFFFLFILDAMLGIGIIEGIIKSLFSNQGYNVILGNRSGNNIKFVTFLTEKDKIIKLEERVREVKEESKKTKKFEKKNNSSDLDDLMKLGELFKSGLLTKEEFDHKKGVILGGK